MCASRVWVQVWGGPWWPCYIYDICSSQVTAPGYYYFFKSNFCWFMCLGDICLHSSGYLWHVVKLGKEMNLQPGMSQIILGNNLFPNSPIKGPHIHGLLPCARNGFQALKSPAAQEVLFISHKPSPFSGPHLPGPAQHPRRAHHLKLSGQMGWKSQTDYSYIRKYKWELNAQRNAHPHRLSEENTKKIPFCLCHVMKNTVIQTPGEGGMVRGTAHLGIVPINKTFLQGNLAGQLQHLKMLHTCWPSIFPRWCEKWRNNSMKEKNYLLCPKLLQAEFSILNEIRNDLQQWENN